MDKVRKLKEAAEALIGIVEGINGAMNHGTWRAEKSNLRMKDTDEWMRFYNATRDLTPASDGRAEGLREAAEMFHQEQVIVWVQDIVEGLGFADVLKIDSYDDNIAAHEMIEVGLMRIRDAILARAAEREGGSHE